MSDEALIRALGADHRNTIAAQYHNRGAAFGFKMARRYITETLAEVCEAHSRRDAYDMAMRCADQLVKDRLLGEVPSMPGVLEAPELEPLPAVKAALDRHAQSKPSIVFDLEADKCIVTGMTAAAAARHLRKAIDHLDSQHRRSLKGWRRALDVLTPAPWVRTALMGFLGGLIAMGAR